MKEAKIQKEVRQRRCLSSKAIEEINQKKSDLKIQVYEDRTIRFSDDTVLLEESWNELEDTLKCINKKLIIELK